MHVYRITLTRYSDKLIASGNPARWSPKDVYIIYTASSRSLACLENVVNRDRLGLLQSFVSITIDCPASIKIKTVRLTDLPSNWRDYSQIPLTQGIGEQWVKENKSALLRVPSAVIEEEFNYLLNPKHEDFKLIKILKSEPFIFDNRIKR
jgi:RES domain-containing protein